MKRSSSLRRRIISASFAMTFVICLLFAAGLFIAFEIAEESLFEEHLETDMTTFMEQYAMLPEIASMPRDNFQIFIAKDGDQSSLPDYIRNLGPDEDDIELDGRILDLEIRQSGSTTFYFIFNEASLESFEQILMVSVLIIIMVICLTSVFLGFAFADQIIKPVTRLAERVNSLENTGGLSVQPGGGNEDEIETLSLSIDSFQKRVSELLTREREFSSDSSHELRTPLMGIQAAAENLQMAGAENKRVVELARRIEARCKQMRSLIDAMLFLARDPHSLENDFQPIALLDIVKDQLDSASHHIESKGINTLIIENDTPVVFTSAAILSVIFGNLLRNAVIHSESEDIHLEITARGFSIKDFGQGMPDELKDRMFERYSNGAIDSNEGVGIGLSLVKRLCDHFGWTLEVDSVQGTGTTISVDFGQSIRP